MRYHVLACDYDGTLAHDGHVNNKTLAALERVLATGRRLVLVTGRELPDLLTIFPDVNLFARVVAENGALLYQPADKSEKVLANPPPAEFADALRQRGVQPISTGRVIIATWRPHEAEVLCTIADFGLELQVVFNKDAVMVLPSGVNKATGLAAALESLELTPHEAVGVGDAENDHAFLRLCECAVAVANALPAVKQMADLVTSGDHGAGVAELIDQIIATDLAAMEERLARHCLLIGHDVGGGEVRLAPYGCNVLIAGPSGSGKSTAATSFLEQLSEHRYQYCIIDPEGDYENLEGAVTLGNGHSGPTVEEILQVLANVGRSVVVNLIGLPLADRPPFFLKLLPRLLEVRARLGHPHWLVIDEAHHLLPASWVPGPNVLPQDLNRTLFITVHPDQVARTALETVTKVMAVGQRPDETIQRFCGAVGERMPRIRSDELGEGEVVLWSRGQKSGTRVRLVAGRAQHHRHVRKYAEGELPPERSFYFRGPKNKLNLRAQNLIVFMQMMDGVDDATWTFHLRNGEFESWFRDQIKDASLADQAAQMAREKSLKPADGRRACGRSSRRRIHYLPARRCPCREPARRRSARIL